MGGFREFLNESSMSRVYSHTQGRNIGIITANRGEYTAKENQTRNKSLENDIRKAGHGFIHVKGRYIENRGTPQEKEIGTEHSYLVVGKKGDDGGAMKGFLSKHGAKYEQDSVLHKSHDSDSAHWLYTKHIKDEQGKTLHKPGDTEDQGPFHPRKIGDYHSKLTNGGSFTFTHTNESESNVVQDFSFLVPITPAAFGKGKEQDF